jgi:hypothetical protein
MDDRAQQLIESVGRLGRGVEASNLAINQSNDAIDKSNKAIADLAASGRRTKHTVHLVMVSVGLDIALSIATIFLGHVALTASHRASVASTTNKMTIVATCKNSNDVRADDVKLWNYIVKLTPPKTAAAQKQSDNILAFVATTFAQRQCG